MSASSAEREQSAVPKIGDKIKDVALEPVDGKTTKLSRLTKDGPLVLVLLRGYPGYQCPICTRQVGELRKHANDFEKLKARVVLIYPGAAAGLKQRAEEFLKGTQIPKPFLFAIDPDYQLTAKYGLRWDAAGETAYPATFVIDQKRVVRFRKISKSHGDRAPTAEVLKALAQIAAGKPASLEQRATTK